MRTVLITSIVAVSLTFTAYASLPPDSGSLDWEDIEMQSNSAPERKETVCQSVIKGGRLAPLRQTKSLAIPLPEARAYSKLLP